MKAIITYLAVTFTIPFSLWITMNRAGLYGTPLYMVISALIMLTPLLATLIGHILFKERTIQFSWKVEIRRSRKAYLMAWLSPAFLSLIGIIIFALIFPSSLKVSMQGRHIVPLFILSLAASPFNALFALGEEAGWRGFLYPRLREKMGKGSALITVGMIWGLWHTPINIMGYNYGTEYPGYPLRGIAAMCLSCTVLGAWASILAERSGSIWPPALFHGAVNSVGGLGLLFLKEPALMVFGPALTGIIPTGTALLFLILLNIRRGKDESV